MTWSFPTWTAETCAARLEDHVIADDVGFEVRRRGCGFRAPADDDLRAHAQLAHLAVQRDAAEHGDGLERGVLRQQADLVRDLLVSRYPLERERQRGAAQPVQVFAQAEDPSGVEAQPFPDRVAALDRTVEYADFGVGARFQLATYVNQDVGIAGIGQYCCISICHVVALSECAWSR